MIRPFVMVIGFIGSTFALLWALGGGDDQVQTPDQVSRSTPDIMGLQPALTPVDDALSGDIVGEPTGVPTRPVARPAIVSPQVTVAPARQVGLDQPTTKVIATSPDDKVSGAIEAMGYGILQELKKPVARRDEPDVASLQAAVVVPAPASAPADLPQTATRTYTVQSGDSLPGIAFRFYGTTVAYLQILEANQDVVREPKDLRAGMVLTIPE